MSKRSLGTSIALLTIVTLTLAATPVFANSQVRIVRLSSVEGTVKVDRNSGNGYENAFLNMPMVEGMKLASKDNGRAEVEFEDGSTVRITPKSSLEFTALGLRDSGARVTTLTLRTGQAYVNYLAKQKDEEFTLAFGNETVPLTRAAHFRLDIDASDAVVAVFKGDVQVQSPSGTVDLSKNNSVTFDLLANDKYTVVKNIEEDPFDAWDKEQTKYQQEYASKGSYKDYPYGYGVSDLNYYGSYTNVPGYGMMWQPYFAGASWCPFDNGAWMFYPNVGYTWISGYPWGWMPFRYGNWAYVPNYGWMWAPGFSGGGWYAVPPLTNPPNRFPVPRPPQSGSATVVVGHPVVTAGGPPRRVLVQNGSAGMGIPRGAVNNLGKVSQQVQRSGFATVHTAPPSRSMSSPVYGTSMSGGGHGTPGGSHVSSGSSSGGHMSTGGGGHMGGSSGGHSAPSPGRH
jgi:uncharacterized membrane protein YgcG